MPEVLGNIATALQVDVREIQQQGELNDGVDPAGGGPRPGYHLIRLKRITSARDLAEIVTGAHVRSRDDRAGETPGDLQHGSGL